MSAVYKKEINQYLHTLPGCLFATAFLLGGGLLFSAQNILEDSMDLKPLWRGLEYILLILAPVLTMRLLAGERSAKTDMLLMTAPVSVWAVTAAKFLAALTVFSAALFLSLLYPLILCLYGSPSWAQIFTGYLGLWLLGMLVIAVGLFVSSLMKRPLAALLSALGVMLFIMLIDSAVSWLPAGFIKSVVLWAAPLSNATYFLSGFINMPSVIYFLSVTLLCLYLTTRSLEHAKWSKGRRL